MKSCNNRSVIILLVAAAWLLAIALVVLVYLKAKAFFR
jgi:hypothetical protein